MVGDAKEILAAISTRAVAYPARLIDGDSDEPADRLPSEATISLRGRRAVERVPTRRAPGVKT